MKTVLKITVVSAVLYLLLIIVSHMMVRPCPTKPFVKNLDRFTLVGHQGAPLEYPGNSLASFEAALEINSRIMLEMDVHQTRDKVIVVNHDKDVATTTNGKGKISQLSLQEVQALESGYHIQRGGAYPFRNKGHRIPRLETVLKQFGHALMSIDIKHHTLACADQVMALLIAHGALDRVVIGSFDNRVMDHIRTAYPGVATSFSQSELMKFFVFHKLCLTGFFRPKDDILMIPEFSDPEMPEYLGPDADQGFRVITQGLIKDAVALNLPVIAWTINRKENMERLRSWGISGIITDQPDLLDRVWRQSLAPGQARP